MTRQDGGRPREGVPEQDPATFTHLDEHGHARMVDVTGKAVTLRRAVARCVVRAEPGAIERAMKTEDAVGLARAAGLAGAKQAPALIPLCHPLPLDDVDVRIDAAHGEIDIRATTVVAARTGVEMEALAACGAAGLTMVMHVLPFDPCATLSTLALWQKSGGRSGTWERDPRPNG